MFNADEMSRKLEKFLARRLPDAKRIKVSNCSLMTGGYSCVTSQFTASIDGPSKRYIARADAPASQAVVKSDRLREWTILSALSKIGTVPIPKALFADEDGSELGAITLILDFAEGGSFLSKLRASGEDQREGQTNAMCDLAAEIHATNISLLPACLERPTDWDSYIDGLIALWKKTEAELSDSIPMLRYMAAWLDQNRPPPAPLSLVHGEFQSSNQVLNGAEKLLAIDWEFPHIGDPREDIGWCIWVESVQPPALITRDIQSFCQRYCARSGLSAEIVNPLTVAYFSILPSIRVFAEVLRQKQAFSEGSNKSMQNGYLVGAVASAYEGWFNATQQIEVAQQGAGA